MASSTKDLESKKLLENESLQKYIAHLRENCDKILDKSTLFIIDSNVLASITEEIIEALSIHAKSDLPKGQQLLRDRLLFLFDLFQITPSLCINEIDLEGTQGCINIISRFGKLEFLELRKISPVKISGLNSVKKRLKTLKCSRCLDNVEDILFCNTKSDDVSDRTECSSMEEKCSDQGDDDIVRRNFSKVSLVWSELTDIDFSYNKLGGSKPLSWTSFEVTPCLENLNLSRNNFNAVEDYFSNPLPSLTVLNLSYNKLTRIPPFPPTTKKLILAHNKIQTLHFCQDLPVPEVTNLRSKSYLSQLEVLDLSRNMISDANELTNLQDMICLKNLFLIGNPLSYMENYRKAVLCNLNPVAVKKRFSLDKKNLSSSEVLWCLEQRKRHKFVPFIPNSASRFNLMTSLTQSYDSTCSSIRSTKSKRPKIREVVMLSSSPVSTELKENVDLTPEQSSSKMPQNKKESESPETWKSSTSDGSEVTLEDFTTQQIVDLRERYGEENWLLRQAAVEVNKLMKIEEIPLGYQTLSKPSDQLGLVEKTHSSPNLNENHSSKVNSFENEEPIKNAVPATNSECADVPKAIAKSSDESIFFRNNNNESEVLITTLLSSKTVQRFRSFKKGRILTLMLENAYLYEVDLENQHIESKWDLTSLISFDHVTKNNDTDSISFTLNFDTMKKKMREKSFVMEFSEFKRFKNKAEQYIIRNSIAMHFFDEVLQCLKCHGQISKADAQKIVKTTKNGNVKEVLVCPVCSYDILVAIEPTVIPYEKSMRGEENYRENLSHQIMSTNDSSSPISVPNKGSESSSPSARRSPRQGGRKSQQSLSIPKACERSPLMLECLKQLASSFNSRLTSNSDSKGVKSCYKQRKSKSQHDDVAIVGDSNSTTKNPFKNRSDSDIEVLSCDDSSSIEVLTKLGNDSSSDVEVPEAIEVDLDVPKYLTTRKEKGQKSTGVVMSESTSSGSFAESTCTTYERKLPLNVLSQPLNSPSRHSMSSTSSIRSASTITGLPVVSAISPRTPPIAYDFENFTKVDHRLQLFCELSVFKGDNEKLLSVAKVLIIFENLKFLAIAIFSNMKVYFYKIAGNEGDNPKEWLQKFAQYPLSAISKLDVLIGRHGVAIDVAGKYYVLLFRDSKRTSNFLDFFMNELCLLIEDIPMVADCSQSHKALMSPKNPISYFGVLRHCVWNREHSYPNPAIVLTNEELIIVHDVTWMAVRCETVLGKHMKPMSKLKKIEVFENDGTYLRLLFESDTFFLCEVYFETNEERSEFLTSLVQDEKPDLTVSSLCPQNLV